MRLAVRWLSPFPNEEMRVLRGSSMSVLGQEHSLARTYGTIGHVGSSGTLDSTYSTSSRGGVKWRRIL
ncbi:hypothetical protein NDU88_006134 [Pleurodeles waltl]|uniref:Uncharacterized protein n=1 Tax=Pleurodeles waltl TaxID=8319 RepID=A0AAV7ULI9_PLEWA|nr:hypothetical protein NDU88_006134 [Pleurodeles waltl]